MILDRCIEKFPTKFARGYEEFQNKFARCFIVTAEAHGSELCQASRLAAQVIFRRGSATLMALPWEHQSGRGVLPAI
jgi:hypothetical protein